MTFQKRKFDCLLIMDSEQTIRYKTKSSHTNNNLKIKFVSAGKTENIYVSMAELVDKRKTVAINPVLG